MELTPEDVDLDDIVHSLSHICRFTGHTAHHHSVLKHSMLVAMLAVAMRGYNPDLAVRALLHDASEAYLNDLATPVKLACQDYLDAEARANSAIKQALRLPSIDLRDSTAIACADQAAFWLERHLLVDDCEVQCLSILSQLEITKEVADLAVDFVSTSHTPEAVREHFWGVLPMPWGDA